MTIINRGVSFDAASGITAVNGVTVNTNSDARATIGGESAVAAPFTVINAAFNAFPHAGDDTTPFLIVARFGKNVVTGTFDIDLRSASYGRRISFSLDTPNITPSAVAAWRGGAVSGLTSPVAVGQLLNCVIRGVWTSATTYAIDIFTVTRGKVSGSLNCDPAHTPDRILVKAGVSLLAFDNRYATDDECFALLDDPFSSNTGGSPDATATGGTGTGAGSGTGGNATGGSGGTDATATGGTGTGAGSGSGGNAVGGSTGSFTAGPVENNAGSPWLNQPVAWTWTPAGRVGSKVGKTPIDGTGTTHATTGVLVATGLPAGTGQLDIAILGATAADDLVYQEYGTVT